MKEASAFNLYITILFPTFSVRLRKLIRHDLCDDTSNKGSHNALLYFKLYHIYTLSMC